MINPMHVFCVLFPVSQAHERIQVVWAPNHEIYDDLKKPKKFNTFSITDERISPGNFSIGKKSQGKFRLLWGVFRPDMCQDPKKIQDPGSAESMIWNIEGSWILYFYFTIGILGILNPDEPILSQDPRDPGSRTEKKHVAGSRRYWILCQQSVMGSCGPWIFHSYYGTAFWTSFASYTYHKVFCSPKYLLCLNLCTC